MEEPLSLKFRVFTVKLKGVRKFWKFAVNTVLMGYLDGQSCYVVVM